MNFSTDMHFAENPGLDVARYKKIITMIFFA